MKYLRITLVIALLVLTPLLAHASLSGLARLSLVDGDVQLRNEGEQDWLPAAINTPLLEGDSVWCPAGSRAEIQLANGAVIRLDSRSSLEIVTLDEGFGQFHLGMGHLYVNTGRMRDRSLQFDIDETSVKVYDRSRFRIDIDDDGSGEDVSIFKGTVYVESGGTNTRVRTGEMLSLEEGHAEIAPLAPPDAWESWNRERDRRLTERRVERSYLPDELNVYADDLDANGRWVEVEEYGYVWQPAVVEADWAPYRVGRWCWVGGDYVWISYENWGWAPYHYGRWLNLRGRGWCWVPPGRGDVYWSPGYVGWIVTPTYVGWVPLAPGETYYGRGYYGRASVNITQVNVTAYNYTTVVYRNASAANGLAVVDRNTFVAGRPVYVRPTRNITTLMRERSVPASPAFRPTSREARMPVVKPVPRTQLPPPTVGRVPVRELRERHPRLEERRPAVAPAAARPAERGRGERVVQPPREESRPATRPVPATPPAAEKAVPVERGRPAVVPARPQETRPGATPPAASRGEAARPGARPQAAPTVKRVWNVKPGEPAKPAQKGDRKQEQKEERKQERREERRQQ